MVPGYRVLSTQPANPRRPMNLPAPLERYDFETAALVAAHPPRWRDPNKRLVFQIGTPAGASQSGQVIISRWPVLPLPERLEPLRRGLAVPHPGFYSYTPALDPARGACEWHLNFADPHLFGAYGSSLLAQDELQVLEHPALGSLRGALDAMGRPMPTFSRAGPTPVLVSGVERRLFFDTAPNPARGYGTLYGNAFAQAPAAAVRAATQRINPPTISNILAIAAPSGGAGHYYQAAEIELILATAYSGFALARAEGARLRGPEAPSVVHSGYWGCGAFGGNRVLMVLLQMIAAANAGLERLVLHTGSPGGSAPAETAAQYLAELTAGRVIETSRLIAQLAAARFAWGVSDGN